MRTPFLLCQVEGNYLHYHGKDKWVESLRREFVEAMYLW